MSLPLPPSRELRARVPILLLGASTATLQTLAVREGMASSGGNEAVVGALFGIWMLLTAAGAALGRHPGSRVFALPAALAIHALSIPATIFAARAATGLLAAGGHSFAVAEHRGGGRDPGSVVRRGRVAVREACCRADPRTSARAGAGPWHPISQTRARIDYVARGGASLRFGVSARHARRRAGWCRACAVRTRPRVAIPGCRSRGCVQPRRRCNAGQASDRLVVRLRGSLLHGASVGPSDRSVVLPMACARAADRCRGDERARLAADRRVPRPASAAR